jgi:hypothetical protein
MSIGPVVSGFKCHPKALNLIFLPSSLTLMTAVCHHVLPIYPLSPCHTQRAKSGSV